METHGIAIRRLEVVDEIDKLSVDVCAGAGIRGLGVHDICIDRSAKVATKDRQVEQKRRA